MPGSGRPGRPVLRRTRSLAGDSAWTRQAGGAREARGRRVRPRREAYEHLGGAVTASAGAGSAIVAGASSIANAKCAMLPWPCPGSSAPPAGAGALPGDDGSASTSGGP